jgi:ribosome-associated protein
MEFELEGEFIQLSQLLKATGIAESGAMAFQMIDDGVVKLNGEPETRRRKKIFSGDKVEIFDEEIIIK